MTSAIKAISYNSVFLIGAQGGASQEYIDYLEKNGFTVTIINDEEQWKISANIQLPSILMLHHSDNIEDAINIIVAAKILCKSHPLATFLITDKISPEDQEKFFQAGGDEVFLKPFGPTQLISKVKHYSRFQKNQADFSTQISEASDMALLAMENSSDLGGILNFVKSAIKSKNYYELAEQIFAATNLYSETCMVEMKGHDQFHYFCSKGAIDLDVKHFLLSQKPNGRVIQMDEIIQVNQEHLVLILEGLPTHDPGKMDRITDTLVMLCDAANRYVKSLSIEENLNKAEISKHRFLTTLSHELRTPLNGILGFSKALTTKNADNPLGASGADALNRIFESSSQINAIIKTLIDLSNTTTGSSKNTHRAFKIDPLIIRLKSKFKQIATDKGLSFILNSPEGLSMISDEKKVITMLNHLVDNAIKFTDDGEIEITIDTKLDPPTDRRVIFTVKDTGMGIDPKNHSRIFTEVGQLNNEHNRRHYGVGLGLYYTNLVSQQLNGNVSIKSEQEKGSTFTLDLPLGEVQDLSISEQTSTPQQDADDLFF
jgi:signal transduction histidine kinase/CheY-like chemotaxis protein